MRFKTLRLFLSVLLILSQLYGCGGNEESTETDRAADTEGAKKEDFYIVSDADTLEKQTAEYIAVYLGGMGYTCRVGEYGEIQKEKGGCRPVIAVGKDSVLSVEALSESEKICCVPDLTVAKEGVVSPSLTSGSLVRAAVLLFSGAESFTVLSCEEGAADVQDACDYLDRSGVNYTVCSLEGSVYGDAVLSAVKKGCDVLIVPFGDITPMKNELKKYGTAVVAVGEGEPVGGAVATFCIDTERLSRYTARLAVSRLTGEDEPPLESFYKICIDTEAAKDFDVDIEALREDFFVTMVS